MITKTAIRKTIGRGKFTSDDFAQSFDITPRTARTRLSNLLAEGVIDVVTDRDGQPLTAKVTDAQGNPHRGRPRRVFRVASGK